MTPGMPDPLDTGPAWEDWLHDHLRHWAGYWVMFAFFMLAGAWVVSAGIRDQRGRERQQK